MKFIKVDQHNGSDFYLINLANVTHVIANKKSGTCKIVLTNKEEITCFPIQARQVLEGISKYNDLLDRAVIGYSQAEEEF